MSGKIADILISSFTKILLPGIRVTIPLTILAFILATVIALALALV